MIPLRAGCSVLCVLILAGCHSDGSSESVLRRAFKQASGRIELPAGISQITAPIELAPGAHDLEIVGSPRGSVLRMSADFKGAAAIVGRNVSNIGVRGFEIVGSRGEGKTGLKTDRYLPPSNRTFADYYDANGILFVDSRGIRIEGVTLRSVKSFPVLISRCDDVSIQKVSIGNSGTLNSQGRSNTTGGILLEEGTSRFHVSQCRIREICGNGVWTHSNYSSPRNRDGTIEDNRVEGTPRDAFQVGHASRIRVMNNRGSRIGYPPGEVDVAAQATAAALDSAGDVAESTYSGNHFTDVDGQCIDLDGFHDGKIIGNSCTNNGPLTDYPYLHEGVLFGNSFPEMTPGRVVLSGNVIQGFGYGGVFLIGENNTVTGNRFVAINRNHCTGKPGNPPCNYALDEPGMLRSGIYLAGHAARPARTRGNVIRRNYVSGFGARRWCIGAGPGVSLSANDIGQNECVDLP